MLLVVLLVHDRLHLHQLVKRLLVVVVLVRCLWESLLLQHISLLESPDIVGQAGMESLFPLAHLLPDDLRARSEVMLAILTRVLIVALVRMQRAQVLEFVRVVVIVERVLALRRAHSLVARHRHQVKTAVVHHLPDLLNIQFLQGIEVDRIEQVQLLIGQLIEVHVAAQLLQEDQHLGRQVELFAGLVVQDLVRFAHEIAPFAGGLGDDRGRRQLASLRCAGPRSRLGFPRL